MRLSSYLALLLSTCHAVTAQDGGLASAISNNTNLSGFKKFLDSSANAAAFNSILPSGMDGITFLVPTNAALDKYYNKTGQRLGDLPWDNLTVILRYHTFAAKLTRANFTSAQRGLTVPTLLKDTAYNNRTAGTALVSQFGAKAAQGNVVFVSSSRLNPAKLRVRQAEPATVSIRGGLASDAAITAVDGRWALGLYQVIDSVLEPPAPCDDTVRALSASLQDLDTALNRTDLWDTIYESPNVTCLAPNNGGFKAANNPQTTLNLPDLEQALLLHTLPQVAYSNFLQDGDVFKSLQGGDVKVTIVGNDIYFNDAKVVSPNVLTNNGLIHVLDRVMSPNGTAPTATPSSTPSSTPSAAASPSPTKSPNTGPRAVVVDGRWPALLGLAVAGVLL